MVIVRRTVALVDGHVELVGAFDQVERVHLECDLRLALEPIRLHLLDVRVRTVNKDSVRREQSDSKYEIAHWTGGSYTEDDADGFAGVEHLRRHAGGIVECD